MASKRSEWQREYAGRYVSRISGWMIERSTPSWDETAEEHGPQWKVVNPETGRDFDSFDTLAEAKRQYSNIR